MNVVSVLSIIFLSVLAVDAESDPNVLSILNELQSQVRVLTEEVQSLQEQGTTQQNRISELEDLVAKLQGPKETFSETFGTIATTSKPKIVDRTKEHDSDQKVGDNPINEIYRSYYTEEHLRQSRLVSAAEGPVAFQAHLSGDLTHIGLHQKILFDSVTLNLGNGYHGAHGLFIAPRPGIYIFSGSILSHVSKEIEMLFMKNGVSVGGGIVANSIGSQWYDQGSATVVTQLKAGDEIWLEHAWPDDSSIRGSTYTCFMGCLVVEL